MRKILFYFLIAFQINSFSQEGGNISGTIYGLEDNSPLIGASIKILNTKYQTVSDIDGKFILQKIPVGIYKLKVSYIGYNSVQLENIEVETNKNTSVIFQLSVDTIPKHGALDSATIFFTFYHSTNENITYNDITIEYSDSIFNYSIYGSDFFVDETSSQQHTIKYKTCTKGISSISFQLIKNDNVVSSGNLSLPLVKDWNMHISFFIEDENPMKGCYGCRGYKAFRIDNKYKNSKNDSLYITWSGNYIENPVVY